MSTTTTDDQAGLVRPKRQILIGLVLLLVGSVLGAALIEAGANVLAGPGLVVAVAGLVILGNGALLARPGAPSGDSDEPDGGVDRAGAVALALAVVLPPAGILVAAYSPIRSRRGAGLRTAAFAVGAVLTVLYTFLLILGAAFARTS